MRLIIDVGQTIADAGQLARQMGDKGDVHAWGVHRACPLVWRPVAGEGVGPAYTSHGE